MTDANGVIVNYTAETKKPRPKYKAVAADKDAELRHLHGIIARQTSLYQDLTHDAAKGQAENHELIREVAMLKTRISLAVACALALAVALAVAVLTR